MLDEIQKGPDLTALTVKYFGGDKVAMTSWLSKPREEFEGATGLTLIASRPTVAALAIPCLLAQEHAKAPAPAPLAYNP